jgi:hypothetical protein
VKAVSEFGDVSKSTSIGHSDGHFQAMLHVL